MLGSSLLPSPKAARSSPWRSASHTRNDEFRSPTSVRLLGSGTSTPSNCSASFRSDGNYLESSLSRRRNDTAVGIAHTRRVMVSLGVLHAEPLRGPLLPLPVSKTGWRQEIGLRKAEHSRKLPAYGLYLIGSARARAPEPLREGRRRSGKAG